MDRTPTFTALEAATARAGTQARAPRLVVSPHKTHRVLEPVARTDLWKTIYAGAIAAKQKDPEKFADSAVRAREASLRAKEGRSKLLVLADPPKPPTASAEVGRHKPKTGGAPKCQAKTLEGRPCGFAATCGNFCKKHTPKVLTWRAVKDRATFDGTSLRGYLNAKPAAVKKVFGEPVRDSTKEMEWLVRFEDDTLACLYFCAGDPALQVAGKSVDAVARVRSALA